MIFLLGFRLFFPFFLSSDVKKKQKLRMKRKWQYNNKHWIYCVRDTTQLQFRWPKQTENILKIICESYFKTKQRSSEISLIRQFCQFVWNNSTNKQRSPQSLSPLSAATASPSTNKRQISFILWFVWRDR